MLKLTIKTAKIQWMRFVGRDPKTGAEKVKFWKSGTLVEFNDGQEIKSWNGQIYFGHGTIFRFSFKTNCITIQPPQRCSQNRLGHIFDRNGEPIWLKSKKSKKVDMADFKQQYSAKFVSLCLNGHVLAMAG